MFFHISKQQQNNFPYYNFFTGIDSYNAIFTPMNILKEYSDLVLDDIHLTTSLGIRNIQITRDEWIKFLIEKNQGDNEQNSYYNFLCK